MGQALRSFDVIDVNGPPAPLREPLPFPIHGISSALLEDLRERADVARQYEAQQAIWSDVIDSVAFEIETETRLDNLEAMEQIASRISRLEVIAEQRFLPRLRELQKLKEAVGSLPAQERAAWLGLLNPYAEGLKRPLDALRDARHRIGEVLAKVALKRPAMAENSLDALLDQKAIELYQVVAEEELHLRCERSKQEVGGEVYQILIVKVPFGISRPHRVYHESIERIHERVLRLHPEYAGRVGFVFERARDAA